MLLFKRTVANQTQSHLYPHRYPFTPGWREAISDKASCRRTQAPQNSMAGLEPTPDHSATADILTTKLIVEWLVQALDAR